MDNNGNLFNQVVSEKQAPAQNQAMVGFVLGIISLALAALKFFSPDITIAGSLLLGIFGIIFSAVAQKRGNNTGIRKAGLTLSIISVVLNALVTSCATCAVCTACIGLSAGMAAMM